MKIIYIIIYYIVLLISNEYSDIGLLKLIYYSFAVWNWNIEAFCILSKYLFIY